MSAENTGKPIEEVKPEEAPKEVRDHPPLAVCPVVVSCLHPLRDGMRAPSRGIDLDFCSLFGHGKLGLADESCLMALTR